MPRRDIALLALVFVALAALIGLGPGQVERGPDGQASSHGSGPGGALALYRWLEALDYETYRIEYEEFDPWYVDMLIVLAPRERYSADEVELVREWVEYGGVLLVAEPRPGPGAPAAPLLEAFGLAVEAAPDGELVATAPALQPALGAPPVRRIVAQTRAVVTSKEHAAAPLAGGEAGPVLVGMLYGGGYVIASSSVYPFSNAGLRDADNAAAVLNLLRHIPPEGLVAFDEVHHGFVGQPSLRGLLLGTPWGWATLYAAVVGAGHLILTGRRFGRPVPLRAEAARRTSAEYLASMAGLLRRAGKGAYVQEHFRQSFRRRLARAYGLSPDLDDQALVDAIAQSRPAHARAAADLLARLARPAHDDAAILAMVREADALLEA